jgi:hypothetical protein
MKHVFLIIFSISIVVAPSLAAPFDGEVPTPFGGNPFEGNPFEGYQMRSVAPMYEEKQMEGIADPYSASPYYRSSARSTGTTDSYDDYDDEYNEEDGPGTPWVDDSEIIPLTMGWDAILLLITLAFIYAISIAQKRKKTPI